jgi:hypothetical protein
MLDIRTPIGLLFLVLGALLTVYGPFGGQKIYDEHSLGININLWWGLVMFGFGALMFILGRRDTSSVRTADESPEGRKLEETERQREGRPGGH